MDQIRTNSHYKYLEEFLAPNNQILSIGDLIGSPFMNKPFELDLTNNNLTNVSCAIVCGTGVELNIWVFVRTKSNILYIAV